MATADPTIEIEVMWGTKILEPVKYRVEQEITGRWPWKRTRFFIVSDFGKLGPFDTVKAVCEALAIMKGTWR